MRWMTSGPLFLAITLATGAVDVVAQQGLAGPAGPNAIGRAGGVEAIMRMRERLELTDDQIGSLDVLRQAGVRARNEEFGARNDLQSRFQAGQIDRAALGDAMRAQREASRDFLEQQREQIGSILTEDQMDSLSEIRGRAGAFAQGRASARRSRMRVRGGVRQGGGLGRGVGPGLRGQRFQGRGGMMPLRGFRGGGGG